MKRLIAWRFFGGNERNYRMGTYTMKNTLVVIMILASCLHAGAEDYKPDFSLKQGDPSFGKGELWLYDKETRIGTFRTENSSDAGGQKLTLADLRLKPSGKPLFWWVKFGLWRPYEYKWETGKDKLTMTFSARKSEIGQTIIIGIYYDNSRSSYIYDFDIRYDFAKGGVLPGELGSLHVLPANVIGGHHNSDKKYNYFLVEHKPDRFVRIPHIAGAAIGMSLAPQGIVAYIDDERFEDTIVMQNVSVESPYCSTAIGSCPIDFNAYISCCALSKQPLDHALALNCRYLLYTMPDESARALFKKAELVGHRGREPLYEDGINSFEKTVDYSQYSRKWVRRWSLLTDDAYVDHTEAHTGKSSVKVGCKDKGGICMLHPAYFGLNVVGVRLGKTYELSAWVKTRAIKGKAWIGYKLCRVEPQKSFDPGWIKEYAAQGDRDWHKVALTFKVKADDFNVSPAFGVDGQGIAWFDDVALKEINDEYIYDDLDLAKTKVEVSGKKNFKLGQDIALLSAGTKVEENIRIDRGAEEVIDGDEHGVLCGVDYWGNYPYGFMLDLGQPRKIGKIEIRWYSPVAYGTHWMIDVCDGKNWRRLREEKDWINNDDYLYAYALPAPVEASKIRFLLLNAAGGETLHMRRFSLFEALED